MPPLQLTGTILSSGNTSMVEIVTGVEGQMVLILARQENERSRDDPFLPNHSLIMSLITSLKQNKS